MEDLLGLVASANKISIGFFVVTFGFLIFEFYLFKKEKRIEKKPQIPKFDPKSAASVSAHQLPQSRVIQVPKKRNKLLTVITLIIALVIIGGIGISYMLTKSNRKENLAVNTQIIQGGIHFFSLDWTPIAINTITNYKNREIYITLQVPPKSQVDKARIRVNQPHWSIKDETQLFNEMKMVYYRKYTIPVDAQRLEIYGQLHDSKDGWPIQL